MNKQLLPKIFFGLSIAALAAVVFIVIKAPKTKESALSGSAVLPIKAGEKVVIDEYSDFQCPACRVAAPILEELRKNYPDKIEFNYRHFPLSYHKNSRKAAEASEAARDQGKFWEYHDMLFEKQSEWEKSDDAPKIFKKFARDLKLDAKKFEEDLNSGKFSAKVEAEFSEGERKKVNATPTVFVNGQKVDGFKNWEEFKNAVEEKIK